MKINRRLLRLPFGWKIGMLHDPHGEAEFIGDLSIQGHLGARVYRNGKLLRRRDYQRLSLWDWLLHRNDSSLDLGSGLVTHAGVRLLSQDTAVSAGAATLNIMKNHGTGTGTTAATATDTALQTAIGTTATAGTNTNSDSSPNAIVTSTATVSYGGANAVTEWGLFNQTTLSGATMWDHRVFSAINVDSTTSIAFTYTLTINSGG